MINKSNQQGYTMLETIMYVSLLIVLGTSLAGYMHKAMQRYKIGRVAQQVIDLKKAAVMFTAADEDYTKLSIAAMEGTHSLPLDMRTGDPTKARHALGGEIKLGPVTALSSENDAEYRFMFFMTFKNLPQNACAELLTQGQFYGDGSELDTLIVNNNAWKFQYSFYNSAGIGNVREITIPEGAIGVSSAPRIELNMLEALSACSKKENNSITWIFS